MKQIVGFIFFTIALYNISFAQSWQKILGQSNDEVVNSVIHTQDNGLLSTCVIQINGQYDMEITKMDINGNIQWNNILGGMGNKGISAIQDASGNYVLVGYLENINGDWDVIFIKLDINGNIISQQLYGEVGYYDNASIMELNNGGGYLLVGGKGISHAYENTWASRLDYNGNVLWAMTYDNGYARATAKQTQNGDILIVGVTWGNYADMHLMRIDVNNGSLIWEMAYDYQHEAIADVLELSDQTLLVLAEENPSIWNPFPNQKSVLMRLDALGNIMSAYQISSPLGNTAMRMINPTSDDVIIAGIIQTNTDVAYTTMSLNINTMNVNWQKQFTQGTYPSNVGVGIEQLNANEYLLFGTTNLSPISGNGNDFFLVKEKIDGTGGTCETNPNLQINAYSPFQYPHGTVAVPFQLSSFPSYFTVNTSGLQSSLICGTLITSSPYQISPMSLTCDQLNCCPTCTPKVCIPLTATSVLQSGITGLDFCYIYDPAMLTPTGNVTLGSVVTNGGSANHYINYTMTPGELHVSIFYNGVGELVGQGDIACVEFAFTPNFTVGTTTCVSSCELI